MLFNHIFRNAKLGGNFRVCPSLEFMKEEHVTAFHRQFANGLAKDANVFFGLEGSLLV